LEGYSDYSAQQNILEGELHLDNAMNILLIWNQDALIIVIASQCRFAFITDACGYLTATATTILT